MIDQNPEEKYAFLQLFSVARVGSMRIKNLMSRFKSPTAILSASTRELEGTDGIDKTMARQIKKGVIPGFAENQMDLLARTKARLITFWDKEYPPFLKKIYDPPVVLFVRGHFEENDSKSMAIVGTRSPSSYARLMAEKFARELAQKNITVVSGLARGVDTVAHQHALSAGGRTIAVLGSGVDVIYPGENSKLSDDIISHGSLVSELPMGTRPDAPHFPRRNRIISGMSLGSLVIEAGQNSGALITADFAVEQGREVFAVPGNINNPKSIGCNKLIQQGAKLVHSIDDILEEIKIVLVIGQQKKKTYPTCN